MLNLFELLQRSQGGDAIEAMARQFGLSPPQAESAVDALLPAFAVALQRSFQDPQAMMNLAGAMAQAQQKAMMDAAVQAMGGEAKPPIPGVDMLTAFFGTGDLAKAVAAQAAAVSGLSPQILQQMLPAMAAMLTAGLVKSLAEGGMGAWLAPMMKGFGASAPQAGLASGIAAYQDMVGKMMDAAMPPRTKPEPEPEPTTPNPFDPAAFAAMMGRMMGVEPPPPPEPEPAPEPPPPPPTSSELGYEALSQMVETGRAAQEEQVKAMQALFSQMLSRPETR